MNIGDLLLLFQALCIISFIEYFFIQAVESVKMKKLKLSANWPYLVVKYFFPVSRDAFHVESDEYIVNYTDLYERRFVALCISVKCS